VSTGRPAARARAGGRKGAPGPAAQGESGPRGACGAQAQDRLREALRHLQPPRGAHRAETRRVRAHSPTPPARATWPCTRRWILTARCGIFRAGVSAMALSAVIARRARAAPRRRAQLGERDGGAQGSSPQAHERAQGQHAGQDGCDGAATDVAESAPDAEPQRHLRVGAGDARRDGHAGQEAGRARGGAPKDDLRSRHEPPPCLAEPVAEAAGLHGRLAEINGARAPRRGGRRGQLSLPAP